MQEEKEGVHTESGNTEIDDDLSGAESEFRIYEKLGEGGFGEVYRAIDLRNGDEVALKVNPSLIADYPKTSLTKYH